MSRAKAPKIEALPVALRLELAAAVAHLPETQIAPGPSWTRRASANLIDRLAAPREATLSVAKLGPLTLIAVPGEPTAAAGRELRKAVGDPDALILGLCNGYVGYIETPDRVAAGTGESPRQYYDASLLDRFTQAAALAARSLASASPQPPAPSPRISVPAEPAPVAVPERAPSPEPRAPSSGQP